MIPSSLHLRASFVAVCLLGATLAACQGPTDATSSPGDLAGIQADNVIFGMVSYLTSKGVRQGRIDADTAYIYNDSSSIQLEGMHVVFYAEDGTERAVVVAERGELDQVSDRMVARGNVVLTIRTDGRKIESPELQYDPNRDRIWSDSATVMTMADGRVTRGTSFESDLSFENVKVANPRGAIGEIVF
jgi:LPS export ABC transporter protein LptC